MKLLRGSLPRNLRVYGTVGVAPAARAQIVAPLSATVAQIYVRRGEEVEKGAPLVRLEPSPQTAASYVQAVSALDLARELVQRTREMVRSHLATAQALAQAEKSAADARAALSALDAQGADGPRTLTAPYRAIVTAIGTSVGAIVSQGSGLLDLARPTGLVLEAGVVAARAGAVRPGEEAKVTALGARDGARGRVVARGSLVDPASGLVPVEIALPAGRFLPGERAEAAITVGVERGYVVPHEAILVDDSGNPYVVEALDGVAKKVGVRVVAAEGDKNVVRGPLDAGALLVLSGNYQLRDGMRVRVAGTPQKTGK